MKRMTVLMPTLVYSLILYTCYQACGYYQSASPSQGYFTYQNARVFLTVSLCMTNLFCYTRTVLGRQKGSVQYLPHPQSQLVAIQPVDATGQPLTCSHCRKVKTARTHHCRQCNQCQPGMDHHCVWFNRCVDHTNRKLFFLFLVYVSLYAISALSMILPLTYSRLLQQSGGHLGLRWFWSVYKAYLGWLLSLLWHVFSSLHQRRWLPFLEPWVDYHLYLTSFLGLMFGITLIGFTLAHLYYILTNKTSIEHVSKRPLFFSLQTQAQPKKSVRVPEGYPNPYHQGYYQNWCEVMGSVALLWFVPTPHSMNPHVYYNLEFCNAMSHLALRDGQASLDPRASR